MADVAALRCQCRYPRMGHGKGFPYQRSRG